METFKKRLNTSRQSRKLQTSLLTLIPEKLLEQVHFKNTPGSMKRLSTTVRKH